MAKSASLDDLKRQLKEKHDKSNSLVQSDLDNMFDKYELDDDSIEELNEYIQDNGFKIVEDNDDDVDIDESKLENVDKDDVDDLSDVFDDEDEEDAYEADIDALERSFAANQQTRLNDPVKMYLKEIGQVELLSADEEVKIAKQIELGAQVKEEYEQIKQVIELSKESVIEELEEELNYTPTDEQIMIRLSTMMPEQMDRYNALKNIMEEGDEAKKKLIASNLRLVVSIAKKYVGRGMLFLDLIQEGNMGLAKAVEKFDYNKGFKFSTYATWWIRQAITRAIADQARTIRIPVHMVETINKLTRIQRQLVQDLGREPTAEEIAEKMENISPEKVREIQKIALEPVSLETPIGDEDDSHLGDFIEDKDAMSPDEYANNQLLKDEINNVLQGLTEREEKVLRLRFGLYDGKTRTLEEVGKEFNVTRERIRQIEAKALRKLKHPTRSKRLKDFVDHS